MSFDNQNPTPLLPVQDAQLFRPQDLINRSPKGYYEIWTRPLTGEEFEEYIIMSPADIPIETEMQTYEWRRKQSDFIVKTHFAEELQLRVFTEKTQRLYMISKKMPLSTGISVLVGCLKGFACLFQQFGFVSVTDGMIGIDSDHKPKVWININFARNLHLGSQEYSTYKNEQQMLISVFKAIEQHCEPHPSLSKLKASLELCQSFLGAIEVAEGSVSDGRLHVDHTQRLSPQNRKYFSRTPECRDDIRREQHPTQHMKLSYASCRQHSFKCIQARPSVLVFKQPSEKSNNPGSKKRVFGKMQKTVSNSSQSVKNGYRLEIPLTSGTALPQSGEITPRSYFYNMASSKNTFTQNCKQRQPVTESIITKELSFRSHKPNKNKLNTSKGNTFKPPYVGENVTRKRAGSISYRSPPPLGTMRTEPDNRIQSSYVFNPVAKSMTIAKNQSQKMNNFRGKDNTKESTNDFDYQGRSHTPQAQQQGRRQFPNIKMIDQSIIQEGYMESSKPCSVGLLKHSLFNRTDDLKQSEIIIEPIQQKGLMNRFNTTRQLSQPKFPPQQSKYLVKMNNKPMTQSITLPNQAETTEDVPHKPTTLDKYAKMRTQSRLHGASTNKPGSFVTIKQTPEEQF